ncbi:MAG: hypothetical protein HYR88_13070 [Verrucomicrobia bacterium]|nr:hypothetical protein [Verrucomicrobiota bacterium]MBI3870583.1 hypothetical protein [Verrucomicrobiota bacterium]
MRALPRIVSLVAFSGLLAGCDEPQASVEKGAVSGHVHVAPHGGVLLPLGEHAFNVEFVLDRVEGALDLYALDGHAENFLRLPSTSIAARTIRGGTVETISFAPVASSQTGETVGDTSRFRARSDGLKQGGAFSVELDLVEIRGQRFEGKRVDLGR